MKKILLLMFMLNSLIFAEYPNFMKKWDSALKEHVHKGEKEGIKLNLVRYQMLGIDPRYIKLIDELKTFNLDSLETMEEKLAFWINVYNIGAIKTVVDNYPVKSIRDVGSLFKSVWKREIIEIDRKKYSLLEIENDILRTMGEDRIHFAINCASLSCPDLRIEAYIPNKLEEQLEEQKKEFLNDTMKGIKFKENTVYISKIFKWFSEDFDEGNLHQYLDLDKSTKIKHLNYNWSLNEL